MPELYQLTAGEASGLIRSRQLSPVELTQALLRHIDRGEPLVQAWQTLDREGALSAAQAAESQPEAPLRGVPFGAKDIFFTRTLPTTASFEPFRDFVAGEDARAVSLLRDAGAVLLGKTVTVQFALADPPKTVNPWNAERTPGGSSSGSAAAVAARHVPLALGTQTAGSVLRPAAFCGVVGFKPSFGRVSRRGVFPLAWTLDHVGVLCRSVADAELAFGILDGHDSLDPFSARSVERSPVPPSGKAPRLGLVREFLDKADSEVRQHVELKAAELEQAGASVRELSLSWNFDTAYAAQQIILRSELAALHAHLLARQGSHYGPRIRAAIEVGQLIPAAAYVHSLRLRRQFRAAVEALFAGIDALLSPTVATVAPDRTTTGNSSLQALWSLLGLPAITLPSGLSQEGLPLAVQLAGPRHGDEALLSVARWTEPVLGPMPAPPLPG